MRFHLLRYLSFLSVVSCSYAQPPDEETEAVSPAQLEQPAEKPATLPFRIPPIVYKPETPEEAAEAERRWAAHEAEEQKRLLEKFGPLPPGAAKWTEYGNILDRNNEAIINKAFVTKALDTPSPQKAVTQKMQEMLFDLGRDGEEKFWQLFNEHLGRGGPPSQAELQQFIQRIKANTAYIRGGKFWFGEWGLRPGKQGRRLADTGNSREPELVQLTSFSVGKSRVTYADFDVFTRVTGRESAGQEDRKNRFFWMRYPDFPVAATWPEAHAYCKWLGQITGKPFDLPTEAQWEYVARDRGKDVYFAGPIPFDEAALTERKERIYRENSENLWGEVGPVGRYGVSALGISDMVGFGYEWMRDWYTPDILGPNGQTNPAGPKTGTQKVIRPASKGGGYAVTLRYGQALEDITLDGNVEATREYFRCVLNSPTPWR